MLLGENRKRGIFMTYQEYFESVKKEFDGADVSDIREHLAYQINVTGDSGAGSFYIEVKDGKLFIEPYTYHDNDVMFTATADTFTAIVKGELDPIWAVTIRKLKVEGNIEKALRFKDLIAKRK